MLVEQPLAKPSGGDHESGVALPTYDIGDHRILFGAIDEQRGLFTRVCGQIELVKLVGVGPVDELAILLDVAQRTVSVGR